MKVLAAVALLAASTLPAHAADFGSKLGGLLKSSTSQTQQQGDLISTLVSSLGVTQGQAEGGTGAIMAMAKDKMSSADFGKLSDIIPNMGDLLKAAPDAAAVDSDQQDGGTSSLLGKATSMLGDNYGLEDLNGAFESLGMDSGMVRQFLPTILDYVQSKGGTALMQSLKTALLGG
ncbi:DUF2780 domain-containing protein [Gallaecimonas pentaromativorans]|uniref:Uncharacterized protein VcgC/VcgE DUF2780 n=1 Tax=Gallaecimonas pentaromativorans TaxID=584787 RepID=A0A3N1PML5_9GAMM|nr:DUF2780 domain-containing protein [Gallaecimonas pentaromativorans]MED5524183.1 DUF2780 domain-containing protein [Pseudomonadota bacterium]ROQ29945.1 uncharacterized protein VcgC/VcgE DUF2780 [Gallaecimonas pentaromativorans]